MSNSNNNGPEDKSIRVVVKVLEKDIDIQEKQEGLVSQLKEVIASKSGVTEEKVLVDVHNIDA